MTAIQFKLKKVLALAEKGVGGEREAAQKLLDKLLSQHNLTIEDIKSEKTSVFYFGYNTAMEQTILHHTVSAVLEKTDFEIFTRIVNGRATRKDGFILTKGQKIEVEFRYSAYRTSLKKELETFLIAFIHKNRIFHFSEDDEQENKLSFEQMQKILSMAGTIDKTEIHKQIGEN